MVKGVCMAFFYTPVGIRKAKRKAFLVPGCGMWTLECLATQKVKVTQTVLTPNMDSSSFVRPHTWQTGLSQMGAKTDMTLFLANIMHFCTKLYIITVNKLSVSS